MKNFLGLLLLVSTFTFATGQALACTVQTPDEDAEALALSRFVAPALELEVADIVTMKTSDVEAQHLWIKSNMCPDGFSSTATFTVTFNDPVVMSAGKCAAVVKVSNSIDTNVSKNEYKVELVSPAVCNH